MKYLVVLFIVFVCNTTMYSQVKSQKERLVVIANVAHDQAKITDFNLSDLRIESKITRAFRLDRPKLKLVNPIITNESGKGWFIQYEFKSNDYVGLWKEQLQLRNGQLVITESRNARIAMATNCEKIEFTNDTDRCKCSLKTNEALDADVIFRVFSSMH